MNIEELRLTLLQLVSSTSPAKPEQVVAAAKVFENYITGAQAKERQAEQVVGEMEEFGKGGIYIFQS